MIKMVNEMLLVLDIKYKQQKVGNIIIPTGVKSDDIIEAIVISSYDETIYPVNSTIIYELAYNKKYIDVETKNEYKIIDSKNVLAIVE